MDTFDDMMAFEAGELSEKDTIAFFQRLIDSGLAWRLQGSYGRMAQSLIANGLCTPAPKDAMFGNTGFAAYAPHGSGPKGGTTDPNTGKRYTRDGLIAAYAKGATKGRAGALRIEGGVLYSYREPIAVKVTNGALALAYVTADRFSVATTRHTNLAAVALARNGWTVVRRHTL